MLVVVDEGDVFLSLIYAEREIQAARDAIKRDSPLKDVKYFMNAAAQTLLLAHGKLREIEK